MTDEERADVEAKLNDVVYRMGSRPVAVKPTDDDSGDLEVIDHRTGRQLVRGSYVYLNCWLAGANWALTMSGARMAGLPEVTGGGDA